MKNCCEDSRPASFGDGLDDCGGNTFADDDDVGGCDFSTRDSTPVGVADSNGVLIGEGSSVDDGEGVGVLVDDARPVDDGDAFGVLVGDGRSVEEGDGVGVLVGDGRSVEEGDGVGVLDGDARTVDGDCVSVGDSFSLDD